MKNRFMDDQIIGFALSFLVLWFGFSPFFLILGGLTLWTVTGAWPPNGWRE